MQGRGIGGLLLDDILNSFPDAEMVRVEVEERNDRALKFYLTQGFLQSGRIANCGGGASAIPALVLEKSLGREPIA